MSAIKPLIKRAFSQASKVQGMLQALYRGSVRVSSDEEAVKYLNLILEEAEILRIDIEHIIDEAMREMEEAQRDA